MLDYLTHKLGEIQSLTTIPSGQTNTCVKVEIKETDQSALYFVKILNSKKLDQSEMANEGFARNWATENGLTPPCLFERAEIGTYIYPYIPNANLADAEITMADKINILAECLAELHKIAKPNKQGILKQRLATEIDLYAQSNPNANIDPNLLLLAQQLDAQSPLNCVCHGDLSFDNIINCQPAMLVDWEYARISEPAYDLASAIVINNLSPIQERKLIYLYQGLMGFPVRKFLAERIHQYKKIFNLLNDLWRDHQHISDN